MQELLAPFIICSWNGEGGIGSAGEGNVARIYRSADRRRGRGNIRCFVINSDGTAAANFEPFPGNRVFGGPRDPNGPSREFAKLLKNAITKLDRQPEARKLTTEPQLPDSDPNGKAGEQRVILTIDARPTMASYRAPIVEVASLTDKQRAALSWPSESGHSVSAKAIASLLQHVYPPAVMTGKGRIHSIEGTLRLVRDEYKGNTRFAVLKGTATLGIDDGRGSSFPATVSLVVGYNAADPAPVGLYGLVRGTYQKAARSGRPHQLHMTAVIEPVK